MENINKGLPTPSNRQIETRQVIKRRDKKSEKAAKQKKENKLRKYAFQRPDNVIRPNDIITDPQFGKVKLEFGLTQGMSAIVKEEAETNKLHADTSHLETVEYNVRIVKEEIDIPNEQMELVVDTSEEIDAQCAATDTVALSPLNKICFEKINKDQSLEIKRLKKTLSIRDTKIKQLNKDVNQLKQQLEESNMENKQLKKQATKKDRVVSKLRRPEFNYGDESNSKEESYTDYCECSRSPNSPAPSVTFSDAQLGAKEYLVGNESIQKNGDGVSGKADGGESSVGPSGKTINFVADGNTESNESREILDSGNSSVVCVTAPCCSTKNNGSEETVIHKMDSVDKEKINTDGEAGNADGNEVRVLTTRTVLWGHYTRLPTKSGQRKRKR